MFNKNKYFEEPNFELIIFSEADVLGTSNSDDVWTDPWENDGWDDL